MMHHITSLDNPLIKHVVSLHARKGREQSGECLVEGARAIATAQAYGAAHHILSTAHQAAVAQSLAPDARLTIVDDRIMRKISQSTTPSGLVGIFPIPQLSVEPTRVTTGLVLSEIADPGNAGTLIRTAAALAVDVVYIVDSCDVWSHKVIQSSAGTVFALPVITTSWNNITALYDRASLCALVVRDGDTITEAQPPSQALYVVGSEAHGLSDDQLRACARHFTIPMPGGTESLNAAIAGSLALYLAYLRRAHQSRSAS